jgi:hypothetical protein
MSEIQEIDIFIKPDGTVKFEVRGVKGKKCLDITKSVEEALGGSVTTRVHTDAFYDEDQDNSQDDILHQKGF